MKKIIFFTCLILVSYISAVAQQADAILGEWFNAEKDGSIEVYKWHGKYYGRINWTAYQFADDGRTLRKDDRNPDPKQRNRTIIGLNVLNNFTYDDGSWTGGTVYDPKSGKTYKSRMKLKGATLELRGYIGLPIFGESTVWTRKSR